MPDRSRIVSNVLGLIGAAAGGVFGYVLFHWVARQGYYALVVPGGMLGLGCGLLARHSSYTRGGVCGVAALGLGLYTDWTFEKFPADPSFPYFLTHSYKLGPVTLVMLGLGAVVAYSLGKNAGYGRPPGLDADARPRR